MPSLLSSPVFGVSLVALIVTVYYIGFRRTQTKRKMLSLPSELLLNIITFCDFATLCEVTCTNKRLHNLIENNSYRLARRHVWKLEIVQTDLYGETVYFQISEKHWGAAKALRIYKWTHQVDDGEPLLTPEAVRDFTEGLKNENCWQRFVQKMCGASQGLNVSDPMAIALPVLEEILKRISTHDLTLDCASPAFLSNVFARLQKHRTRIHCLTVQCDSAKYEHLEPLPRMIDLLGVDEFSLYTRTQCSSEDQRRIASALSNSKLTSCKLYKWTTVPKCLLVFAEFESVEAIAEVIKEWARGERKIVHHRLWGAHSTQAELLAGITNRLRDVRGLRISVDGHLKIEKTTLPEGVEHQKRLHLFCKRKLFSTHVYLASTPYDGYLLDKIRPCVECSTPKELRQAAERLAKLHSGIVPLGL